MGNMGSKHLRLIYLIGVTLASGSYGVRKMLIVLTELTLENIESIQFTLSVSVSFFDLSHKKMCLGSLTLL